MRDSPFRPHVCHVFVCVNRRSASDPLGGGCGDAGDAVYAGTKQLIARRGLESRVWASRTHCLGVCPKEGAAVALSPSGRLLTDVLATETESLMTIAMGEQA